MKNEVQVDPVFKLFAFGNNSAYLFESLAVHPDGYLYLEPISSEDSLTLDHEASAGLTRFDADYLYRTLNRTPDIGYSSNLGIGVIVYPTPHARLDSDDYQEIYEVFKVDINKYLATDSLPGLVGCNISNQHYQKTINLLKVYVNEKTEVCIESKFVLNEYIHTDKPHLKVKTSQNIGKFLNSIDWIELTKTAKKVNKVVMRN